MFILKLRKIFSQFRNDSFLGYFLCYYHYVYTKALYKNVIVYINICCVTLLSYLY